MGSKALLQLLKTAKSDDSFIRLKVDGKKKNRGSSMQQLEASEPVSDKARACCGSEEKKAQLAKLLKKAFANPSTIHDARIMGMMDGYMSSSMVSDAVFEKAAGVLGCDAEFVKMAYIKKEAKKMLPWLLGALALGGGAAALPTITNSLRDPLRYYSWMPYNTGQFGGLSHDTLSRYGELSTQEAMRSGQLRNMLQNIGSIYNNPGGGGMANAARPY